MLLKWQTGDGLCEALTLCKCDKRYSHLFVLSGARVHHCWVSDTPDFLIEGACISLFIFLVLSHVVTMVVYNV